jgi:uncharacterized cupin superfamily protein
VEKAELTHTGSGLAPATPGWFTVNVRDAIWEPSTFGDACFFENPEAPFEQLGIAIRVLWPGRSTWLYHAESAQEDFLVLSGEALLLVEDEERTLRGWDFVHCPPETAHAFVALGSAPCAILMVGARLPEHTYRYPRTALAVRHGVAAQLETSSPAEAQAGVLEWTPGTAGAAGDLPWSIPGE